MMNNTKMVQDQNRDSETETNEVEVKNSGGDASEQEQHAGGPGSTNGAGSYAAPAGADAHRSRTVSDDPEVSAVICVDVGRPPGDLLHVVARSAARVVASRFITYDTRLNQGLTEYCERYDVRTKQNRGTLFSSLLGDKKRSEYVQSLWKWLDAGRPRDDGRPEGPQARFDALQELLDEQDRVRGDDGVLCLPVTPYGISSPDLEYLVLFAGDQRINRVMLKYYEACYKLILNKREGVPSTMELYSIMLAMDPRTDTLSPRINDSTCRELDTALIEHLISTEFATITMEGKVNRSEAKRMLDTFKLLHFKSLSVEGDHTFTEDAEEELDNNIEYIIAVLLGVGCESTDVVDLCKHYINEYDIPESDYSACFGVLETELNLMSDGESKTLVDLLGGSGSIKSGSSIFEKPNGEHSPRPSAPNGDRENSTPTYK